MRLARSMETERGQGTPQSRLTAYGWLELHESGTFVRFSRRPDQGSNEPPHHRNWHPRGDPDPLFPTARGARKSVQPATFTRAFIEIAKAAKVDDARLHDLRRTGATAMTSERIGIPRFIVSRVLNHASDTGDAASVTAIYDRNAYLPEKRRALDAWAKLLQGITSMGPATLQAHSRLAKAATRRSSGSPKSTPTNRVIRSGSLCRLRVQNT